MTDPVSRGTGAGSEGSRAPSVGWRANLVSVEAAAISGILFAVLYVVSIVLMRSAAPAWDADTAEVARWVRDPDGHRALLVGYTLTPFAAAAFMWFVAVFRRRVPVEEQFVSTVFVAGGTVFVSLYLVAASLVGAPFFAAGEFGAPLPDASSMMMLRSVAYGLMFVQAIRVQVLVILAATRMGRSAGALPRWLVVVGLVIAAVQVVNVTFLEPLVFPFPLWVLAVSVAILVRRDRFVRVGTAEPLR